MSASYEAMERAYARAKADAEAAEAEAARLREERDATEARVRELEAALRDLLSNCEQIAPRGWRDHDAWERAYAVLAPPAPAQEGGTSRWLT